jgi:hypothetical protein
MGLLPYFGLVKFNLRLRSDFGRKNLGNIFIASSNLHKCACSSLSLIHTESSAMWLQDKTIQKRPRELNFKGMKFENFSCYMRKECVSLPHLD